MLVTARIFFHILLCLLLPSSVKCGYVLDTWVYFAGLPRIKASNSLPAAVNKLTQLYETLQLLLQYSKSETIMKNIREQVSESSCTFTFQSTNTS